MQDDPLAYLESLNTGNRELHVTIAAMSGNQRLERIVAGLLDETQRTFFLYSSHPTAPATDDHHGQRLQAIAAKEPNAAREAMAAHLHEAQDRIVFEATRVDRPTSTTPLAAACPAP